MNGKLRWLLPFVLFCALATLAWAQAQPVKVRPGDTLKSLLERRVGQRVELVLTSGERLDGKVVSVAEHLVHLGQLRKKEFFDAVVRLQQIEGIVVRVRSR